MVVLLVAAAVNKSMLFRLVLLNNKTAEIVANNMPLREDLSIP